MSTFISKSALLGLTYLIVAASLPAQIPIPSDGSDGALNITSNTVIDLSQAVTGVWSNNNSANAGKGIYDPGKWAVVFKYSSVSISNGATVTFKNHPTHAPVVWLVNGHVIISGALSLNGQTRTTDSTIPEAGPGGFRGGAGQIANSGLPVGSGFGPGGETFDGNYGSGGKAYGSPQILPLVGGSGGQGSGANSGSAGGGAILVASSGTIALTGACVANAGAAPGLSSGSGGGIRLVADQILGNGTVSAADVEGRNLVGRIRIEANVISPSLSINPTASAVIPVPNPVAIWPATNAPIVRLLSVAGQPTPGDPRASILNDVDLVVSTNTATLLFETVNFPTNGTLNVFIKPRHGNQSTYQASFLSGNSALATWQLQTNLPVNFSIIQARAVGP